MTLFAFNGEISGDIWSMPVQTTESKVNKMANESVHSGKKSNGSSLTEEIFGMIPSQFDDDIQKTEEIKPQIKLN